jgi:hypothetical protein
MVGRSWAGADALSRDDRARRRLPRRNAGRPALLPPPRQFAQGAGRGLLVLPGSDPLPLSAEAGSVARYGLVLEGAVDADRPGAGLLHLLARLRQQPATFGRRDGLAACLVKQLAMQWRKRGRAA